MKIGPNTLEWNLGLHSARAWLNTIMEAHLSTYQGHAISLTCGGRT